MGLTVATGEDERLCAATTTGVVWTTWSHGTRPGAPRRRGVGAVADAGFRHLVVPIAAEADARATARALATHAPATERVTLVHVIEKAGGAADKAGVEQRKEAAETAFTAFRAAYGSEADIDAEIVYDTDVAAGIMRAAHESDAEAVAFTPRGGGFLDRLLTGNVGQRLLDDSDLPVLVLPEVAA